VIGWRDVSDYQTRERAPFCPLKYKVGSLDRETLEFLTCFMAVIVQQNNALTLLQLDNASEAMMVQAQVLKLMDMTADHAKALGVDIPVG